MVLRSDFNENFFIAFKVYIYITKKFSLKSLLRTIGKIHILMPNFAHI